MNDFYAAFIIAGLFQIAAAVYSENYFVLSCIWTCIAGLWIGYGVAQLWP